MKEFNEDVYRDQLYTESQSRLLTNIPRVTGTLSFLGSFIILYIILRDRKRKLKRVYHRLLLAYSSIDVLVSMNFALSTLVVPKGTPGVWGAQGTIATCEASGFVTQFIMSQAAYASSICVYYVLVLRYQVQERSIAKYMEPLLHAFALITPLVMGTIMVLHDNYNPTNIMVGWCFINVYPMDCLRRDGVECQRGEGYEFWLFLNNAPAILFFCAVIVSCVLTYLKVRSVESRGAQWSFSQTASRSSERRVRESATQATLYIVAFWVTYASFAIVVTFGPSPATKTNRGFYLPLVILTKIFLPLQGFFNCFIYIRPRFAGIRLRNPELSYWGALQAVLSDDNNHNSLGNSDSDNFNVASRLWFGLVTPVAAMGRFVARWITNSDSDMQMPAQAGTLQPSSVILQINDSAQMEEDATERLSPSGRSASGDGSKEATSVVASNRTVVVEENSPPNDNAHDEFMPEFDMERVPPSFESNNNSTEEGLTDLGEDPA